MYLQGPNRGFFLWVYPKKKVAKFRCKKPLFRSCVAFLSEKKKQKTILYPETETNTEFTPWKSTCGRLVFLWDGLFSEFMWVLGRWFLVVYQETPNLSCPSRCQVTIPFGTTRCQYQIRKLPQCEFLIGWHHQAPFLPPWHWNPTKTEGALGR